MGGGNLGMCVCKRTVVRFLSFLAPRSLQAEKAKGSPGLSRGVVKLTGRPARNAATGEAVEGEVGCAGGRMCGRREAG